MTVLQSSKSSGAGSPASFNIFFFISFVAFNCESPTGLSCGGYSGSSWSVCSSIFRSVGIVYASAAKEAVQYFEI
jgi:hypothetical protein